jgi:hypothetical protein
MEKSAVVIMSLQRSRSASLNPDILAAVDAARDELTASGLRFPWLFGTHRVAKAPARLIARGCGLPTQS